MIPNQLQRCAAVLTEVLGEGSLRGASREAQRDTDPQNSLRKHLEVQWADGMGWHCAIGSGRWPGKLVRRSLPFCGESREKWMTQSGAGGCGGDVHGVDGCIWRLASPVQPGFAQESMCAMVPCRVSLLGFWC